MKKMSVPVLAVFALFAFWVLLASAGKALAHFGMVIPSTSMPEPKTKSLDLELMFIHPMEMRGMDLAKPKAFSVWVKGQASDLLPSLAETKFLEHKTWKTRYDIKRPGVFIFAMEPQPYPEKAEDNYIIHYTKTVVAAWGEEGGWDAELGLKTEIVPLTRPFGNYAGNVFQGVVKLDGKPVPNARVEIEYFNKKNDAEAPNEYLVAQKVKADQNGVFTFVCPKSGWWGFAALIPAEYKIDGKEVELGAVLWIELVDWKTK